MDDDIRRNEDIVRSMIQREDELINHRIIWLTTVQGLLFAAVGFAWDKINAKVLISVLSLLGLLVSVLSLVALTAATIAMYRLYDWWETNKPKDYKGPGVIGFIPSKNSRLHHYIGPWTFLPVLFIIAWITILFIKIVGICK